ncbi:peptide deformylase [Candidatus Gottesmanbacteria bacterium]|nr:peptide deformylase [Candidatus Gottesmanbacteria bacterium]
MIVTVPNPVLTTPAKPVTSIDRKTIGIVEQMKKELESQDNPRGVGLAAPQIGVSLQIFLTKPTESSPIEVYFNPKIVWTSLSKSEIIRKGEGKSLRKEKRLEGCLSIPNIWGQLKRPIKVRLSYMDIEGIGREKEFEGFLATLIQHETDHLAGILFTRRILEQNGKLFRIEEDEKGEEKLVPVEL